MELEFVGSPLLREISDQASKECDIYSAVSASIALLLSSAPTNMREVASTCAAGLLDLFCRLNWTGPPLSVDESKAIATVLALFDGQSLEVLALDGETPYSLCQHPVLLALSRLIFEKMLEVVSPAENCQRSDFDNCCSLVRCLFTQQRLLSQRSESLWNRISKLVENDLLPVMNKGQLSAEVLCEMNMELGHICLFYSSYEAAQGYFQTALQLAGVTVELTGALGKRTKFQEKDIAQILLKVTCTSEDQGSNVSAETNRPLLPQDLLLGDDTLLEQVKFADQDSTPLLSSLQQAAILGECIFHQRSTAKHELSSEEVEAYIRCVLAHPTCWVVHSQALFMRCSLEQSRRRTVERGMMQLQVLVDSVRKMDNPGRMDLFYSLPLSPKWEIERDLARALFSIGSAHSALEVFERLQLWEDVVRCYQSIGRKGKAEEIIRDKLKEKETPTMWCILGDIKDDPQCYLRAWELSSNRSARAQRSLGQYYYKKACYPESVESFQLSLHVNSMQEGLWFYLGCAASKLGDNGLEIKAFQRCVVLEPDFAEAWSNLGAAYLKKKDKERAYRVYVEASKYGHDCWNIWENLLLVSTDVGAFADSLLAYHRLLDLRQKFVDVEVLRILVTAVNDGVLDIQGLSASKLRNPLGELLGRACAQTTVGAEVWRVYADFHFASSNVQDQEKGLIKLQKAQRSVRHELGWDKNENKLQRVVEFTLSYSEACRRVCGVRGSDQSKQCLSSLCSAKLALQGVLTKARAFGLTVTPTIQSLVNRMDDEMEGLLLDIEKFS